MSMMLVYRCTIYVSFLTFLYIIVLCI